MLELQRRKREIQFRHFGLRLARFVPWLQRQHSCLCSGHWPSVGEQSLLPQGSTLMRAERPRDGSIRSSIHHKGGQVHVRQATALEPALVMESFTGTTRWGLLQATEGGRSPSLAARCECETHDSSFDTSPVRQGLSKA